MKYTHTLNADNVRAFCIHNKLYTNGTTNDYSNLLNSIYNHDERDFTADEVYKIAKDIVDHSDDIESNISLTIENVAFYLTQDVMTIFIDED